MPVKHKLDEPTTARRVLAKQDHVLDDYRNHVFINFFEPKQIYGFSREKKIYYGYKL